jgi:hypothetical protein
MSDVYTFKDKENKFTLSVKKEFLDRCPNPENHTAYELNSEFYLFTYLNNPSAPAVIRHKDNREEYWINGRCLNKEDPELAKKMEDTYKFNNKLEAVLSE